MIDICSLIVCVYSDCQYKDCDFDLCGGPIYLPLCPIVFIGLIYVSRKRQNWDI